MGIWIFVGGAKRRGGKGVEWGKERKTKGESARRREKRKAKGGSEKRKAKGRFRRQFLPWRVKLMGKQRHGKGPPLYEAIPLLLDSGVLDAAWS